MHLYRVNIDGTGFTKITSGQTSEIAPVFSPRGTDIAYCRMANGNGDICIIKSDGTNGRCITSGPEHDFNPVYSPHGTQIYFLRASVFRSYSPIAQPAWHDVDVYSINSDGTGLTQITTEKKYMMTDLSINARGDQLMLATDADKDNLYQIWIIPVKASKNKTIVRPNLEKYLAKGFLGSARADYNELRNPRFSPDGNHILFTWPFFEGLYLVDLNTSISERIWISTSKQEEYGRRYPRFSADGKQILFNTVIRVKTRHPWGMQEPSLWIINVDGTGLHRVEIK